MINAEKPHLITPEWPAPSAVCALITTRVGGVSVEPFNEFNLGAHTGDDAAAVARNRQQLMQGLSAVAEIQWLNQVHGTTVVAAQNDARVRTADACFTRDRGLACAVLTADCLPVLICDSKGSQVAAVHAGWRGLASGILTKAVEAFTADSDALMVYLGPAISQAAFEVGIDVLEACCESARSAEHLHAIMQAFKPCATRPLKYYADIYALARAELRSLGVEHIYGGDFCTYADRQRFYSYRRDGETGRMAALIWLV